MPGNWSTLTTADLAPGTSAAFGGLANALGAQKTRELNRVSKNNATESDYSHYQLGEQEKENRKKKDMAVWGDIGQLAGAALSFVPGVGPILGPAVGKVSANMTGNQPTLLSGASGLAGGLAGRMQFDQTDPFGFGPNMGTRNYWEGYR